MDIEPVDAPRDVSRGKSICHSLYTKNNLVFISFDLETGGKRRDNSNVSADIEVQVNVFNEYVNPGRNAVWND